MKIFDRLAHYVEETYGMPYMNKLGGPDDNHFFCPECAEPLYRCDWDDEDFIQEDRLCCPICDFDICSVYEI